MSRSVLAALKVLHSEVVVHRDIKPANGVQYRPGNQLEKKNWETRGISFITN